MRTRFRRAALLMSAVALLTVACVEPGDVVSEGRPVPDYGAADLEGQQVRLADLRGEVVLLNVWATWCYPCRREMPGLEELHRELAEAGLNVIAVSVDQAGATADIREFLAEHDLTMTVLHDSGAEIGRRFSTRGVPETFLIGVDGTLRRHWIGRIDAHSAGVRQPVLEALAEVKGRRASRT
jgi:peroxiredoxin